MKRNGWVLAAALGCLAISGLSGQDKPEPVMVLRGEYRKNGTAVRNAFKSISTAARVSVVQLSIDGKAVAFGTIVDADGLVATKASELIAGKLTAKLATDQVVDARVIATDEDNDLALLKIEAKNLKAVNWSDGETKAGEWVATQGLGTTPDAVGIISGIPRKILPPWALIGVSFAVAGEETTIVDGLAPGSGAEKAGIKPGDVILAVDGKPMKTRTELLATVRELPAGRVVKVQLQRGDEVIETSVALTAATVVLAAEAQAAGRGGPARGGQARGGRGSGSDRMNLMGTGASKRAEEFDLVLQHDTILEPWQCGGPLLDLDGRVVGLNIARAGRVASYALPAALVKKIIVDLKAKPAGQDAPKVR